MVDNWTWKRANDGTHSLVAGTVVCRWWEREYGDDAPAEAALLAAAPLMLAALKGVVSHNAALEAEYKLSDSLMRQVREAIAEATA